MLGLLLGGAQLATGLMGGRKSEKAARKARREEERRTAQISNEYLKLAGKYAPTGEYGTSMFEGLAKQKQLDVGATTQQFLRSGVGGTSFADTSAQYERGVGRGARRTLEGFLQDKYTGLMRERTEFLSRAPGVTGPSYSDIASAYSGVGEGMGGILEYLSKMGGKESTYTPKAYPVH